MSALLVALGALVGAPLRYALAHTFDGRLPWGTVAANVAGSFLLGLFTALSLGAHPTALVGVGFCGAFTTYSAFAVQVVERGPRLGGVLVVVTTAASLAAAALGFAIA